MKKAFALVVLSFVCSVFLSAQTKGELDVSVTTKAAGGNYAPRNILAIWITNENGNFVKTLLANADRRKTHLNNWENSTTSSGSVFNTVDAITSATNSNHGTRTCKWNGKDHNNNEVADGKYILNMELTDKNSTGNFSSFEFQKSADAATYQPTDKPSFTAVSFSWTPNTTSTAAASKVSDYLVYPNPGNGIFTIEGQSSSTTRVFNITGNLLLKSTIKTIDLSAYPAGIYFFHIENEQNTSVKKVIKK